MPFRNRDRVSTCSVKALGCAAILLAIGPACGSDSVAPVQADDVYVEVRVTGGFAAADYSFAVDGAARAVRGISCVNLCDFEAGEMIARLSPAQILELSTRFHEAGILALDGTDFGDQCCDQFFYTIHFRQGDQEAHVSGSSEALPEALRRAVADLQQLLHGVLPFIVDFDSRPDDWPGQPWALKGYALERPVLTLDVEYGGGCEDHEFDLVAWGGWLESFPVQVNVLLAHEDHGDACDALLTSELRFDLTPLERAYAAAYGGPARGATTILLRLRVPGVAEPRLIEYTF